MAATSKKNGGKKSAAKKAPAAPGKKSSASKKSSARKKTASRSSEKEPVPKPPLPEIKVKARKTDLKSIPIPLPKPPGNLPGKPLDLPVSDKTPPLSSRPITPGAGYESPPSDSFLSGYDDTEAPEPNPLLRKIKDILSLFLGWFNVKWNSDRHSLEIAIDDKDEQDESDESDSGNSHQRDQNEDDDFNLTQGSFLSIITGWKNRILKFFGK